jgi:RHS repeat-associated protein
MGATVSGAIGVPGEQDRYTFTLASSTLLYLDSFTLNLNLNWTLVGPTGALVSNRSFAASDDGHITESPVVSAAAGEYTVTVDGKDDLTGSYQVRLQDLAQAVPLTPGTPMSGTLNPGNETDLYRFTVAAGDRFFFDAQAASGPVGTWRLIDPWGNSLFTKPFSSDEDTRVLTQTGTYTILMEGTLGATGTTNYTFNVQPVTITTQALTLGNTVSGAIGVTGEEDRYTFALGSPSLVYFDSLTNQVRVRWSLTGPPGAAVTDRSLQASDDGTLNPSDKPVFSLPTGMYTLTVDGDGDFTGGYQFRLWDLAQATPLTPGTPVTSTLDPANETDPYRFAAAAGDRFFFDVQARSGNTAATWRLIGPHGNVLFSADFSSPTSSDVNQPPLPQPGTYTLLLEGRIFNTGISGYTFNVQPMGNTPQLPPTGTPLTLGSTVSDSIAVAGEQDRYVFTLPSAAVLYFDSLTNNSSFNWTLVGPAGTAVNNLNFIGSDARIDVPNPVSVPAGTYTLTVAASGSATGAYQFRLWNLAQVQPLTPGTPVNGELNPANETDLYRFTAAAGDRFIFDVQAHSATFGTSWRLIDPHGSTLFNTGFSGPEFSDVRGPIFTQSGTYTLLVEGSIGSSSSSTYTLNVQRFTGLAKGDVFVSIGQGKIHHYDNELNLIDILDSQHGGFITGMVFDASDRLLVTNINQANLTRFDTQGNVVSPNPFVKTDPNSRVESVVFDAAGNFYVGQAAGTRDILKFSADGTLLDRFDVSFDLVGTDWIELAADQRTIYYASEGRSIQRYDVATRTQLANFATLPGTDGTDNLFALRILGDGGVLVADRSNIKRLNSAGQITQTYDVPGENEWFALNLDPDGTSFWSANFRTGNFYKFDIVSGNVLKSKSTGIPCIGLCSQGIFGMVVFGEITAATTNIDLVASDPQVSFRNLTGTVRGVGPGQTATFNTELTGDGVAHSFDLVFVRAGSGVVLGSIPVTTNTIYFYAVRAIDPEGDPLTYRLLDAPTSATIDAQTGRVSWVPSGPGQFHFRVQVSDGRGGLDSQDYDLTVTRGVPNQAPVITSTAPTEGMVRRSYAYRVTATDPNNDPLSFYLTTSPAGMTIDRATGVISWIPTATQVGGHPVTVRVLDGRGGQATQMFTVTVVAQVTNRAPLITSVAPTLAVAGQRYRYDVIATDPDSERLTFDLPVKPDGMTIDASTGVIVWTPVTDQEGPHTVVVRVRDGQEGVNLQGFDVVVAAPNNIPTITSQPFGPAVVGRPYQYSFRAQDPDNDPLTFRLVTSPTGMTIHAQIGVVNWTPASGQVGTHRVVIEVSDGRGGIARQTFDLPVVAVEVPNDLPTILSQPPGPAVVNVLYRYQVRAEDANGDPLNFRLHSAPSGMIIDGNTGLVTWTPTAAQVGTHSVGIAVSDPRGGITIQSFNLAVLLTATNDAPSISSQPPSPAVVALPYQYQVRAQDPNGDALSFQLEAPPSGMAIDTQTGLVTWAPTSAQVGMHRVTIAVSDGRGATTRQAFDLPVVATAANNAPRITSQPPGPAAVAMVYQYSVRAEDPNGDPLSFRLDQAPSGMMIGSATGLLTWTPASAQAGTQRVVITVSDGRGGTATQTFDLQVVVSAANDPPTITSVAPTTVQLGRTYIYAVQASDANHDSLTFAFDTAPAGMTVSNTGMITWTPTAAQFGSDPVTLRVQDGRGAFALQQFTIRVTAQAANQAPSITSNPPLSATVGQLYQYDLKTTDPEGDPVVWRLDAGPEGMSLEASSGTLRWTPRADQIGPHDVVLQAVDAQGAAAKQSFTITVRGVNLPPTIASTPSTTAAIGVAYTYAVQASDPNNDPLTFALTTAPAGMTADASTGVVRWTPLSTQLGPQNVAIRVTDGQGGSVTQLYTITVSSAAANRAPVITSTPVLVATVGQLYQYTVTATDPDGEPPRFVLEAGPSGMTIDPATGRVQWIPTAGQAGSHPVSIAALDAAGAGSRQTFTLVASVNQAPTITSAPVRDVTAGLLYRYDVRATDPNGDPLSFQLEAGPTGMTIDTFGRVTWSPGINNVGTHPVRINVSDTRGASVSQAYDLTVRSDQEAPRVNVQLSANPVAVGTPVTFVVTATDNVEVQTLTLTIGSSPVGLDPNGRVTLAPTTVGPLSVVGRATDAGGLTGTATVTLSVFDPTDTEAPVVALTAPSEDAVITAPVNVVGTASDSTLSFYKLEVCAVSGASCTEFARSTTSVVTGVLGRFDPTLLTNDTYIVRLTAQDSGGHISTRERVIHVAGALKLGNFTLSFTDLSIPVSGIPITVSRTYDTLQANTSQDFGFGWRLEFRNVDLRTSVPRTGLEASGLYNAFRDGTRVYVTLPGGRREGFTFRPSGINLFGLLDIFHPEFEADPGVTSRLTVPDFELLRRGNEYFGFALGYPYNPADVAFGARYTITTKDGLAYEIDPNVGHLFSIADRNNNKLTFSDAGIESSAGQRVVFGRDSLRRIISVTDPMGNPIRYRYDAKGDLVSVTDQESYVTQFVYSPVRAHYLERVIDPLDRTGIRSEYDNQGRLVRTYDGNGNPIELTYDLGNLTETIRDGVGNPITLVADERGNVIQQIRYLNGTPVMSRRTYDANSRLLSSTDPLGHTTTLTFDSRSNLRSVTKPHPTDARPVDFTTFYIYNQRDQLTNVLLPSGAQEKYSYDAAGNLLSLSDENDRVLSSWVYGSGGVIKSASDAFGTVSYVHDAAGNPIGVTDSLGRTMTATYNAAGWITSMTAGDVTSTFQYDKRGREDFSDYGNGITVDYGYGFQDDWTQVEGPTVGRIQRTFDVNGRLASWSSPEGARTTFVYDRAGRLEREVNSRDGVQHVRQYRYDSLGRLERATDLTSGASVINEYDLADRLKCVTDAEGNKTCYTYIPDGRVESITNGRNETWRYSYTPTTITVTDPLGQKTTLVQSSQGLPVEILHPDGTKFQTRYALSSPLQDADKLPASMIDEAGRTRSFSYNSVQQLLNATDLAGKTYTYDYQEDRLRSVIGPTGERLSFTYDELANRKTVTYPDGGVRSFTYGPNNLPRTVTLPTGASLTYAYNPAGRVTSRTSSTGEQASFQYDDTSALKQVDDSTGRTEYTYDSRGNLQRILYPNGASVEYGRDLVDRVSRITTKASASSTPYVTQYHYDQAGNLDRVIDPLNSQTTLEYDGANRLVKRTLPNGVVTFYEYNNRAQVTAVIHKKGEAVLSSVRYERRGAGEPTKITREDSSFVLFDYDAALRLKSEAYHNASGGLVETIRYEYDDAGNRLTRSDGAGSRTYHYEQGFRLLEVRGASGVDESYGYDTGGRVTRMSREARTLVMGYDTVDHLTSIQNQATGTSAQYSYDGLGRRVQARDPSGAERRFLVAPTLSEALESSHLITNGSGTVISAYIYWGADPLLRMDPDGQPVYYLEDGMGSVIALADGGGQAVASFLYDGFGNLRASSGPGQVPPPAAGGDFRFHGAWLESGTGLYHFRARDYDARVGRFLTRDSVELHVQVPESMNPYAFAFSNPQFFSDPTGLFTLVEVNIAQSIQSSLQGLKTAAIQYAKQTVKDRIGDFIGDLVFKFVEPFIPGADLFKGLLETSTARDSGAQGKFFDFKAADILCKGFSEKTHLYLQVRLSRSDGQALDDGLGCPSPSNVPSLLRGFSYPDYLVSIFANPSQLKELRQKSQVVGDFKMNVHDIRGDSPHYQFYAIIDHAKNYGWHVALWVAYRGGKIQAKNVSRLAAARGVIGFILIIAD